jgi:hypothetical protein
MNLTTSSASLNSTNGLLNVANTGASTTGMVARIQSNSTAGSGMTVLANGNVGIGTASPGSLLDVQGTTWPQVSIGKSGADGGIQFTRAVGGSTGFVGYDGTGSENFIIQSNGGAGSVSLNFNFGGAIKSAFKANAGGTVNVTGGTSTAATSTGGALNLSAGNGFGTNQAGGNVTITAGSATGSGAAGAIALMNGNVGIGTASPGALLDVKGAIRLSGATSGYTGFQPAAAAGSTVWTLPVADSTGSQYLKSDGAGNLSWGTPAGSGGTVTDVSSANADIAVATGTSTPVLTLNSGTGADQIVKLTAAAKYPAVDGSLITNLDAGNIATGTLPVTRGGTGQTSYTDGEILIGNTTGNTLTKATLTAGSGISVTNGNGSITLASTLGTSVDLTSEVTGVLPVANGGTGLASWGNNSVVVSNGTGSALTSLNCTLGQVIKFDASGFAGCGSDIGSATSFVQDGNSFGAAATLGTNDNFNLNFETNNTTRVTIDTSGNVGIGTTTPTASLQIVGPSFGAGSGTPANALTVAGGSSGTTGGTGGGISITGGVGNNYGGDVSLAGGVGGGAWNSGGGSLVLKGGGWGPGGNVTLSSGASGNSGNAAGTLNLLGGSAIATGSTGGPIVITGGAAAGNSAGGSVTINGGAKSGTGTDGNLILANLRGKVGIGTNSPAVLLESKSSLGGGLPQISGTTQTYGIFRAHAGNAVMDFGVNSDGAGWIQSTDATGLNNNYSLLLNPNGGKVAIGTATVHGLLNLDPPAGTVGFEQSSTGTFNVNSAGVYGGRFIILENGNVGVGITTPGAPLDVKGAIRLSGATSGYTGFQPAAAAGSTVWTLPVADGSPNQVLMTDGSGILSWTTAATGTVTGTGTTDKIPKFTAAGTIGDSAIADNGITIIASRSIASTTNPVAAAAVDLSKSNTHTLATPGGAAITLTNMSDGGVYNIVIADTATSRTYTFAGCNASYFKPANGPTTVGTRTIYGIMTVYNGATYDCYITWSTGFQ